MEPSGPAQACNEIALPATITFLPFPCFVIMLVSSAPTWLLHTNEIKFMEFLHYNKQSSLIGKAKA